jgi:hypothetical protein
MAFIRYFLPLPIVLALAGCSNHHAVLSTAVAPGKMPSRADPIYLTTPEHPTIAEQKAEFTLRDALCRNGYTLVPEPKRARWQLSYRVATSTDPSDRPITYSAGRAMLLGPAAAIEYGDPESRTTETLLLTEPGADGVPVPVWQGEARTTEKEAAIYAPVIHKVLLDQFGKDFQGRATLSKPYLYEVQESGPCQPNTVSARR